MSKQTELLDVFTAEENVRYVLTILQRGDDIRHFLMARFMKELMCYLQERPDTSKWELTLVEKPEGEWAAIHCWDSASARESQYLTWKIHHSDIKGGSQLAFVLCWPSREIAKRMKHQSLTVSQLGATLSEEGFHKCEVRFRYKYLFEHRSVEDFLASTLDEEEKSSMFRQISDCFWPQVKETAKLLATANTEISRAMQT